MQIIKLENVDSTHLYLKKYIKENGYKDPLCILAKEQSDGIGSRGNTWLGEKGNLFMSFVFDKNCLSKDLPLQSSSIYFAYILANILQKKGSKIWLKWPNDFYINDKKLGGVLTTLSEDLIYCGIGMNLNFTTIDYGVLDLKINILSLLEKYFKNLESKISWKYIFSQFKLEFYKSKSFKSTIKDEKISLADSILAEDGSIIIQGKRVYSLR